MKKIKKIFHVYHIRIIAHKKIGSHDMKQTDSSINIVRNVFVLTSASMLVMSNNLPERVQILGHAHILCITVRDNRIICCQIFCDLLLKSAFEQILNEATNTNFIVFGLTQSELVPTIYRTRDEHAIHYTPDAVLVT
jgi:hypothetical protein